MSCSNKVGSPMMKKDHGVKKRLIPPQEGKDALVATTEGITFVEVATCCERDPGVFIMGEDSPTSLVPSVQLTRPKILLDHESRIRRRPLDCSRRRRLVRLS